MDKDRIIEKLNNGDYVGAVRYMLDEVNRLEALLAAERMYRKQTEVCADRAMKERDRYKVVAEKYEAICKIINGGT